MNALQGMNRYRKKVIKESTYNSYPRKHSYEKIVFTKKLYFEVKLICANFGIAAVILRIKK